MTLKDWPNEAGSFPHLSGITFSVNKAIPSSIVTDENGIFVCVSGEYRVYDLKIYNKETEKYEPIDLNGTYTIAASNHYLLEYGSGMQMLESANILQNDGILDVEVLENYINEVLGGTIGKEYADVKTHITFTDGVIESEDDVMDPTIGTTDPTTDVVVPATDTMDLKFVIIGGVVIGTVLVAAVVVVVIKKSKKKQGSV